MDVENLEALTPAELDALLEQALSPRVPVEVLYAVLERIGGRTPEPARADPQPQIPPRGAATDRAVRPERPRPPKTPTSARPPASPASQAPETPGAPGAPAPNPNAEPTAVIPIVPSMPSIPPGAAEPTAVIPAVPGAAPAASSNPGQGDPSDLPPSAASDAAHLSRGARAPRRPFDPPNSESGR